MRPLVAAWTVALIACERPALVEGPVARFDSAGVQVIHNRHPAWSADEGVYFHLVPDLVLDDAIEPVGALTLAGRRIVVVDRALPGVLLYDSTGTLLAKFGRGGRGPGEFQSPQVVDLYRGDSIAIYDEGLRRVQLFDDSLRPGRTISIRPGISRVTLVGTDSDGSFLFRGDGFEDRGPRWREPAEVFRVPPDGGEIETILTVPGWPYYRVRFAGRSTLGVTPFGPRTLISTRAGTVAVHTQEDCSVLLRRSAPSSEVVARSPCERRRISPDDVEAFRTGRISRMVRPSDRAWAERFYRSSKLPIPQTAPPFESLLQDSEGLIWAGTYSLEGDDIRTWRIVGQDGRWLGDVALPVEFELTSVGEGDVVGLVATETGEKVVQVHSLTRAYGKR